MAFWNRRPLSSDTRTLYKSPDTPMSLYQHVYALKFRDTLNSIVYLS